MKTKLLLSAALTLVGVFVIASLGFAKTPFDSYERVADKVFVTDRALFAPYKGKDVSHWELVYTEEPNDSGYARKRIGVFSITTTYQAYFDVLWDPLVEHYELRDAKTNHLIHSFQFGNGFEGAFLINGKGAIYQYATPPALLCFGKETKKFELKNGKLEEVKQPYAYWENTETTTLENVTLYFSSSSTSTSVAFLAKGTEVTVLSAKDSWLLIKTPLGLTGWVQRSLLNNTICN